MAIVIKPKRSNTSTSIPSTTDLEIGEIAVNIPDKTVYVRDSSGNIQTLANFSVADPTLVFPTGDYGDFGGSETDAFGQNVSLSFDCLDTPNGTVAVQDLGSIT